MAKKALLINVIKRRVGYFSSYGDGTVGSYLCITVLALKQKEEKQTFKQKEMQWKMGASKAKEINYQKSQKSAREIVNMVYLLFCHS